MIAQNTVTGLSAGTIFYLTLLLVFLTAIITAVVTKWSRDKCLKFFTRYHITLERTTGQMIWGTLRVFSSGLEVLFDHPYTDTRGRRKTSFMMYQPEVDTQLMLIVRYHDELSAKQQARRRRQVLHTFNPGPLRRIWRAIRNFVNTLRDAFNAAIGVVVNSYQSSIPAGSTLATQAGQVTQLGQTLLGKFANAYEPLLEQYIGQPVLMEMPDPQNPTKLMRSFTGYLADYTQGFVAIFNVEHEAGEKFELLLPTDPASSSSGSIATTSDATANPASHSDSPAVKAPLSPEQRSMQVRLEGTRLKVQNIGYEPVAVLRLQRTGFEPLSFGCIIPPSAILDLPASDAAGAHLICRPVRRLDLVAPRKLATIRHAGDLVPRRSLVDELYQEALPLVPRILKHDDDDDGGNDNDTEI